MNGVADKGMAPWRPNAINFATDSGSVFTACLQVMQNEFIRGQSVVDSNVVESLPHLFAFVCEYGNFENEPLDPIEEV